MAWEWQVCFFDPDKISDFYLLIQCHDHGTPSLTTKQTVHVEIVEKINDNREGELKFSYLKLLGNFIRNDVNCDHYYYYHNYYSNSASHSTLSGIYALDQWSTGQYVISGKQESYSHYKVEFVYPSDLHSTHFQAESSVCLLLLLQRNIAVGQKLFTVVAKAAGGEKEENFQIIYELIQEIPDGNTFVIDSISGTVQLRNNQPLLTDHRPVKKQLIIQASKIGTLYDYSKHLNHKIRLLLNLTISSSSSSDNQPKETSTTSLSVHPKTNSRIYLRRVFTNNSFTVYSNHTYEFYTPESISPGTPVLLNTIVYCVNPFNNISEASDHLDKRCELKLIEIDSTPLLSNAKNFYLSPTKFLCDSYSNKECTGYTILTNHPLDRERQDRHIFTLTTSSTNRDLSFSKPAENSVKIILHVQDVNDNPPTLKEPFYSTRILTPPVKSIITDRMTFNPPYYITNVSISYKVPQGYVIIQMNAEDKDAGENARLSYTLHHMQSFPETAYESNSQRWQVKSFIVLNSHTGVLSTTRQLLLSDVGRYILFITVQDHGKPQPLSTNSVIYLNILPMEIYQRPVNDLPDSLSGSHTLPSSSVHSSSSSSASIHQFNTDEYDSEGLGANHLLHLSSQPSESLKERNPLLWPTTIGIVSTIFLLIITIIVIVILYRMKSKSTSAQQEEVKLEDVNNAMTYNLDISPLSVEQNNTTYLPQYEKDILLHYMDRSKCNSPNGSIPAGYIHPNLSSAASLNMYYPNASHGYDTNSFNELTNPNLRYQHLSANESIQDGISASIHYSPISHPFVHNISTAYVTENRYPTLAPTTESI
ncbi:unnamed protein product [Trichobilharzia szidati]|nr:unnamed protein product [Trichobilharzia szidati]